MSESARENIKLKRLELTVGLSSSVKPTVTRTQTEAARHTGLGCTL
ncbi:MAG TPA: hypothetical protein VKV95_20540 [Terriglobia bacterium]|nr:hypothetical protein [Terriglobia bacterium]